MHTITNVSVYITNRQQYHTSTQSHAIVLPSYSTNNPCLRLEHNAQVFSFVMPASIPSQYPFEVVPLGTETFFMIFWLKLLLSLIHADHFSGRILIAGQTNSRNYVDITHAFILSFPVILTLLLWWVSFFPLQICPPLTLFVIWVKNSALSDTRSCWSLLNCANDSLCWCARRLVLSIESQLISLMGRLNPVLELLDDPLVCDDWVLCWDIVTMACYPWWFLELEGDTGAVLGTSIPCLTVGRYQPSVLSCSWLKRMKSSEHG